MSAGPSTPRLLSLSPIRDSQSRPILLLHSSYLPASNIHHDLLSSYLAPVFASLPPSGPLTLVYCHAAFAHTDALTSLRTVRTFRYLYENENIVPNHIRKRIQLIVPLHVSVLTRAHVYISSFGMKHAEYSKIQYADLLVDLEKLLGVDSTLLGLDFIDFEYDERMRFWVGRQTEHHPVKMPDPSKPLIDTASLSFSSLSITDVDPAESENHLNLEP